jgi:hypothetical protein
MLQPRQTASKLCRPPIEHPVSRLGVHDHETGWRHRDSLVVSPAVACLSGLKSAPRKRVRGNPPRVQIPPPPPADKAKRERHRNMGAGVFAVVSNVVSIGPFGASLLDHRSPSRRLARSLWIGVITCV